MNDEQRAMLEDGVNLDFAYDPQEPLVYRVLFLTYPEECAEILFPRSHHGLTVIKKFAEYCLSRHYSMTERLKGNITTASFYEKKQDRIYNSLPDWARTW